MPEKETRQILTSFFTGCRLGMKRKGEDHKEEERKEKSLVSEKVHFLVKNGKKYNIKTAPQRKNLSESL